MTNDNDLIPRGDALECFMGLDRIGDIKDAIAAITPQPAPTLGDALELPEVQALKAALHRISLGSQDSGTTKESLGREARAALAKLTGGATSERE